ncbi:MAG: hypothetical protein NTX48_05570 [Planctomycetales bacterium]|nr:hypothetical protein [Planctomycetales bacterium]
MRRKNSEIAVVGAAALVTGLAVVLVMLKHGFFFTAILLRIHSHAIDGSEPTSHQIDVFCVREDGSRDRLDGSGAGLFVMRPQPLAGLVLVARDSASLRKISKVELSKQSDPDGIWTRWASCDIGSPEIAAETHDSSQLFECRVVLPARTEWRIMELSPAWNWRGDGVVLLLFLISTGLCFGLLYAAQNDSLFARCTNVIKENARGIRLSHLIVSLLLSGTAFFFFSAKYGGPDEFHQLATVRGAGDNSGSSYLIYSNVFLGYVLHWLYELLPTVPVYSLHLALALVACGACILRLVPIRSSLGLLIAVGLMGATLPLWIYIQFTSVAGLLCFLGWLLAYFACFSAVEKNRLQLWQAAGLIVWGSVIRFESFLHATIVIAPVFLLSLWFRTRPITWKSLSQGIRIVALLALVPVAVSLLNSNAYQQEGWSEYKRQNMAVGKINDYHVLKYITSEQKDTVLKQSGWSKNDLHLCENWFFLGSEILDLDVLVKLAARADEQRQFSMATAKTGIDSCIDALKNCQSAVAFLLILLLIFRLPQQVLLEILVFAALVILMHVAIAIKLKPSPYRVYFPAVIGLCVFASSHAIRHTSRFSARGTSGLVGGFMLWLLVTITIYSFAAKANESRRRDVSCALLNSEIEWMQSQADVVFLQVAHRLNFDFGFPLGERHLQRNTQVVIGGSPAITPVVQQQIRTLAAGRSTISLLGRKDVVMILPSERQGDASQSYNRPFINLLNIYLQEHTSQSIESVELLHANSDWAFARLRLAP